MLGGTVTVAQNVSVNSPHNYKRPVTQKVIQNKPNVVTNITNRATPLELQSSHMSVHNYKRQGSRDFAQEAVVAVDVPPLNTSPLNPLFLHNHYKGHFEPIKVKQRVARVNLKEMTPHELVLN